MARKIYSIFVLVLIVAIAALNFYAYRFHWYWEFWWFDIIMHTLGGLWVASCALWLFHFRSLASEPIIAPKKLSVFILALVAVYVIGGGWELFEFSLDKFITFKINDAVNTASDLFFDGVGSIVGVFLFLSVYNIQIER